MTEPLPPSQRKLGTGMMILAWVAGLLLAAYWFSSVEERQRNPNQRPASSQLGNAVEVRLEPNRQGHYLLIGQINRKAVTLLVDTGASFVAVPAALADELALLGDLELPAAFKSQSWPPLIRYCHLSPIWSSPAGYFHRWEPDRRSLLSRSI